MFTLNGVNVVPIDRNESAKKYLCYDTRTMQIKLLQLNMWAGTYFPAVRDFYNKMSTIFSAFRKYVGNKRLLVISHAVMTVFNSYNKFLEQPTKGYSQKQALSLPPRLHTTGMLFFIERNFCLKHKISFGLMSVRLPSPPRLSLMKILAETHYV